MIKALLAHSKVGFRSELASYLQSDDIEIEEVDSGFGVMAYTIEKQKPDVMLIEEEALSANDFETAATFARRYKDLKIIAISAQNCHRTVRTLIEDYNIKAIMGCDASTGEIALAIKAAGFGALIVSSDISEVMALNTNDTSVEDPAPEPPSVTNLHASRPYADGETGRPQLVHQQQFPVSPATEDLEDLDFAMPDLTDRETEILHLVARGLRSKQIGPILNISVRTVETHRANIRKKLPGKGMSFMVALSEQILARQAMFDQGSFRNEAFLNT